MSGILVEMRVSGAGFIFALINVRAYALEKGTCLIPDTIVRSGGPTCTCWSFVATCANDEITVTKLNLNPLQELQSKRKVSIWPSSSGI
jgi:hypothetical protein